MKLITFSCLFVALSTGIGHSEPIFLRHPLSADNLNANARYHARRHARHGHQLHVKRSDRAPYYEPDRTSVSAALASVRSDWPYVQEEVKYFFATGTTVLDKYSGREPVIGAMDCANPTVDWYLIKPLRDWTVLK